MVSPSSNPIIKETLAPEHFQRVETAVQRANSASFADLSKIPGEVCRRPSHPNLPT